LRTPKAGTLDDLTRRHVDFLGRLTDDHFRPVPPLRIYDVMYYRRQDAPLQRPCRVFELRTADGRWFRYPHRKLIHIAGMVRHLAIEAMKKAPPPGVDGDWVETYIAGHERGATGGHRQLSYLPLPSVGHEHTDPGVRRVMIVAPVGDDAWLDHVARRLAGQTLKPLRGDEFAAADPPILVPVRHDNIARFYTEPASTWHSFTPVILPGHDDHKPAKTRALVERALRQSGIDKPCEFEWSAFSRFPKAYSAHKYGKDKKPQGYIRPDHLLTQTAVHLTIRFEDGLRVPGPIAIGAGRHCGFGLMVGERDR
jgi:CRISPR-associated protein Csb2